MANKTMGEIISSLRKEKGMTQKDLADQLGLTDKAVSKWERNLSCPDINTLPKLAEILETSVEELLNATPKAEAGHRGAGYLFDIVLRAIPVAMGIAVVVTSVLGELSASSAFTMLGIGVACLGISLLKNTKNQ
jgi:transcriptional regulator with XRE-family HTH domain